jgi:hypothetical protein
MIRVKKGNCQLIGNKITVISECTLAMAACAEMLAKDENVSIEEAFDSLNYVAKESYKEVKKNEKLQ